MSKFEWEADEVTYTPPPATTDPLQEEIDRIDRILEEAGEVASSTAFVADGVILDKEPLYVYRPVLNASEIIAWARSQGFTKIVAAKDMHVTLCYSRTPVDWMEMGQPWDEKIEVAAGGPRMVSEFGAAKVLQFASSSLQWRHDEFIREGATWDHQNYRPHITISYDPLPTTEIEAYRGRIELGPEVFEEIKPDWAPATE